MIKNKRVWEKWERNYRRKSPVNIKHNLQMMEKMYQWARALGAFPLRHPRQGLKEKIQWIRALHVSKTS